VSQDAALGSLHFEVRSEALAADAEAQGYFHASYRDHGTPTPGKDLIVLDTRTVEGGAATCGSFNGMSWIFSHAGDLSTLEGDPRFFFDDSLSPQGYGTGTEEWGGGGDYWGGETMTLPLAGHPTGAVSPLLALDPEDEIESAYRFLIADALPFGKNARITLEHGALDDSNEHYESVAYWYGAAGPCLIESDSLDVGQASDERAHRYASPEASPVERVSSRYELGPDHVGDQEIFGETQEDGRHTKGTSELSVRLVPDNLGVMLRRTLDYGFPDQRAEVYVADDRDGASFERAGIWYLAGSNRCVYSNPAGELDPPAPVIESSNRRLRSDEFLIRRELTEGKTAIRVRIVFAPEPHPLLPDDPLPELAWSELKYEVYSWVLPH
jgi:D-arabinan exo alpha-(1,3)/(1,5)-arabinofuranosidase (non-reducing end)